MSRWSELFSALSAPDTTDTIDTRPDPSALVAIVSPSVKKSRCRRPLKAHSVKARKTAAKTLKAGASVNCVNSVTGNGEGGQKEARRRRSQHVDTTRHFATLGSEPEGERRGGVVRLDRDRPPANVSLRRWQRFVDDVRKFVDSPFCNVAAALGWSSFDLFGCNHDRPLAPVDRGGLLWLLNGDKLVALTAESAVVQTRGGTTRTYRREPSEPPRALAGEYRHRVPEPEALRDGW